MKTLPLVMIVLSVILGCSGNRVDESGLENGVPGFQVYLVPNDIPGVIDPDQKQYIGVIVHVDDSGSVTPTIFQAFGVRKGFMDSVYETYTRARPIMGFRAGFYNNILVPCHQSGNIRLIFTDNTASNAPDDKDGLDKWYYSDYNWSDRHFDLRQRTPIEDMNAYKAILNKMIFEDTKWSNQIR